MTNLPSSWIRLPLGELGAWYGGATPSKANPEFWADGTIPWLSPKDMGPEVISGARDHISASALERTGLHLVPAGSVVIVVRSGILDRKVPISLVPFATTLNQDMKAIHPAPWVDSRWLAWGLRSLERHILDHCRKAGTTVASIELRLLLDLEFPVPPLPEQQRIVAELEGHLTNLNVAMEAVVAVTRRASSLKRALLAEAFSGRLQ